MIETYLPYTDLYPHMQCFEQRINNEDRHTYFDPQSVAEHASFIYKHCLATEEETMPLANYMDYQKDINPSMREILTDWLIEVH